MDYSKLNLKFYQKLFPNNDLIVFNCLPVGKS